MGAKSAPRRQPKLRYSQNYLTDRALVRRLVRRAELSSDDLVIEIGPGRGIITDALADQCGQVLAIERDPKHAETLRDRYDNRSNIVVFAGDFLKFPLPASTYKVFANIPYTITTAIVAKLTSGVSPPDDCFLVMQREATMKLLGEPKGTMLAAQLYPRFDVSVVHRFRRTDFSPVPGVESVLVRLQRRQSPLISAAKQERYEAIVAAVFSAWKPTVGEAIASLGGRSATERCSPEVRAIMRRRPSGVQLEDWVVLFRHLERDVPRAFWQRCTAAWEKLQAEQSGLDRPQRTRTPRRPGRKRA